MTGTPQPRNVMYIFVQNEVDVFSCNFGQMWGKNESKPQGRLGLNSRNGNTSGGFIVQHTHVFISSSQAACKDLLSTLPLPTTSNLQADKWRHGVSKYLDQVVEQSWFGFPSVD